MGQILGGLCVLVSIGAFGLFLWSVLSHPGKPRDGWVVFEAADDPDRVLRDLYHESLIDSPVLMGLYLRFLLPFSSVRPGPHLLQEGLSPRELAQRLCESPDRGRQKVTLVEGFNRWQIAERLHQQGITSREAFLRAVENPKLLAELQIPGDSAEGYLFPATYPFSLDTDPEELIRALVRETRKRIARVKKQGQAEGKGPPLDLSERELLIFASVVEKETAVAEERARVARVFFNRLAHPEAETLGRLQSDPTAAYGCLLHPEGAPSCTRFEGRVTPSMLSDAQNPYNTYRHAGLPPGPIGNPGSASIEAVLFPAVGDEFFFVADGAGGHRFSETYDQHRAAVEQLRKKRGTSAKPTKP